MVESVSDRTHVLPHSKPVHKPLHHWRVLDAVWILKISSMFNLDSHLLEVFFFRIFVHFPMFSFKPSLAWWYKIFDFMVHMKNIIFQNFLNDLIVMIRFGNISQSENSFSHSY